MRILTNPDNPIQPEVLDVLSRIQSDAERTSAREAEIRAISRPTEEERRARQEIMSGGGNASGAATRLGEIRDGKLRRFKLLAAVEAREGVRWTDFLQPNDPPPPPATPAPVDRSFWWARTESYLPGHMGSYFDSKGLHFTGGPTHHSGDNVRHAFGATAYFKIDANRIPSSGTGLYSSTPYIELFGGLLGYTGNPDITTGDLWAKCWLNLRQTVMRFTFGQTGPAPIVLGTAQSHHPLITEENADRAYHANLPGFMPMPAVIFGNVNPSDPVTVQLDIRFDIELEGHGTLIWCDPEVLLRTYQWPMNPL